MKTLKVTNSNDLILLDDEDYTRISGLKIYDNRTGSKPRSNLQIIDQSIKPTRSYSLASIIMNQCGSMFDHIDHNPFNNQKSNLRPCNHSQNCANTKKRYGSSIYKGVSFVKKTGKWIAQIQKNRRPLRLGQYTTQEEAARIYDTKAKELHGDFAVLNFPAI